MQRSGRETESDAYRITKPAPLYSTQVTNPITPESLVVALLCLSYIGSGAAVLAPAKLFTVTVSILFARIYTVRNKSHLCGFLCVNIAQGATSFVVLD
jgi:hypothetical protein